MGGLYITVAQLTDTKPNQMIVLIILIVIANTWYLPCASYCPKYAKYIISLNTTTL